MSRGSKTSYSPKQRRQARHIEQGYQQRGLAPQKAAARAWATVNKLTGGAPKIVARKTRAAKTAKRAA